MSLLPHLVVWAEQINKSVLCLGKAQIGGGWEKSEWHWESGVRRSAQTELLQWTHKHFSWSDARELRRVADVPARWSCKACYNISCFPQAVWEGGEEEDEEKHGIHLH